MGRLAAWASGRCSPVCSLPQRQRSDQHKAEQRGGPAAAAGRSSFPGLQQEALGALPSTQKQRASQQIGLQVQPLAPALAAAAAGFAAVAAEQPLAPAALAAAGFAAVAADVFAPGSFHLLQPLDQWAHAVVSGAAWDPALQRLLAGGWRGPAGALQVVFRPCALQYHQYPHCSPS